MMRKTFILILSIIVNNGFLLAQKPEQQRSFASVQKPHDYYVQQAELWWEEIQKDSINENNWKNYFSACRNAQGTAGWSKDFVNESPYLKLGSEILELMSKYIPNTFTYNFLMWIEQGFNPERAPYLLKAYEMDPVYPGIHGPMAAYLTSEFDFRKREEVCKKWFSLNTVSPGFLAYGYNMLMSLELNSIILTHYDWDTFPIWMLQDVKNVRKDVLIVNFDMLLIKSYREKVFERLLKIPKLDNEFPDGTNLKNLQTIFDHILTSYSGSRSLYVSLTVNKKLHEKYSDNLHLTGLALKYSKKEINEIDIIKNHFENDFLLDYLKIQFIDDPSQEKVDNWNKNYLKCFELLFEYYQKKEDTRNLNKVKELAHLIAQKGDEALKIRVSETFK